jgi:hypothetical protein
VSVYTQSDRRYEKAAGTADNTFTWAAAYLDTLPVGPFTLTARMVTPRCQAFSAQVTYSGDTASFRIATVSIDYVETDTRNKPPTGARPSAS